MPSGPTLARPSGRFARRRAISAPAAAVVIVAILSASAVAIFWLGISSRTSSGAASTVTVTVTMASSSGAAASDTSRQGGSQVSVTLVVAPAADFSTSGRASAFTCNLIAGSGAYLVVTNAGAEAETLSDVTIAWAGANNEFTPPPAGCQVGAAGSNTATLYVNLPDPATLTAGAVGGQNFTGALALNNGTDIPFSGTFLLG
jgi:hypothetical protein